MADDTENHMIKLLQEMRTEIRTRFDAIYKRFNDIDTRIDGLTHIMTLMAGRSHDLDNRLETLEEGRPQESSECKRQTGGLPL